MLRCLVCLAGLGLASVVGAGDWPQWLGPNRDGSSPEDIKPWSQPRLMGEQTEGPRRSSGLPQRPHSPSREFSRRGGGEADLRKPDSCDVTEFPWHPTVDLQVVYG